MAVIMKKFNQYRLALNSINADITTIENIFITEYMPLAQGAYVKVYLYGLMASRNPHALPLSNADLADLFHITEGDVVNAWQYWKDQGIIDLRYSGKDIYEISFFNINECLLNGKPKTKKITKQNNEYDHETEEMFERIQAMYGSRLLSKNDMDTFIAWINDYDFSPATVILLVEYALNLLNAKDQSYSAANARNYMKTIAKSWHEEGVRSFEDAESWLTENRKKRKFYFDILRALGIRRNPSQKEINLMKSWIQDFHFDKNIIDYAVSRAVTPTVHYVNGILQRWHENGWQTIEEIKAKDHKISHPSGQQHAAGKLTEQDKKLYREKQIADDEWLNNIEDIFDDTKQNP